jgi:hypothetical protein
MTSRLHRLFDATSQLFNVALFNGDPNHSISGDAYRYKRIGLMRFINLITFDDHHCLNAHLNDVSKARKLLEEHNTSLII